MSRLVMTAAVVGLLLAGGVRADNKENIEAAKKAVETLGKTKDAKVRAEAIAKLGTFGESGLYKYVEPGIPKVIEGLSDKDAGVRAAAALAVGQIGPDDSDEVVKKLAELLKDKDETVKANAVKGLGSFGEKAKGAVKDLRDAKKDNGDPKSAFSKSVDGAIMAIEPKKKK